MKKAGKDATKIQQAKIKLARARDVAQAYYRSALKAISQKYGQVRDVVKSAVMKGKEEMPLPTKGKGGKMVSAGIWNKTNKLGKAGIVGGGAAAAAGLGYAGFRAFKKKKQAA